MPEPILKVERLTKRFGGLTAVNEVSFSVTPGEAVGIIGPNGAGKTTLFNLISGFEAPTAGSVTLNGMPLDGRPPHEVVRLGLSRTFQTTRPFPELSVLENIVVGGLSNRVIDFGRELKAARARAAEVCEIVGLSRYAQLPAESLAYGSLKKLEIGRSLMREPRVLMLDEPFAGLSGNEAEEIYAVIDGMRRSGQTLLVIEHKLRMLMRLVDRVLVLNFGTLLTDGTPAEVARNDEVRRAYLGRKGVAGLAAG